MEINPFAFFPVVLDGGKYIYSPSDCTASIIPDWVRVCAGTGLDVAVKGKTSILAGNLNTVAAQPTAGHFTVCAVHCLFQRHFSLGRVSLHIQWASDEG